MSSDPNIVYMKNLIAAYNRFSPPHTPMMKYIGMSITSHIIEEEEIERDEDADHPGGQHEEERVEPGFALRDVGPAAEDRERHQERRQQNEEQGNPVHADREMDAPGRDPRDVDRELHAVR